VAKKRLFKGSESILVRHREGSDKLVMFFGGGRGGLGIGLTPFEFMNLTNDADYNRIFFKDVDFSFYHRGLKGHTTGLDDSVEFVRDLIGEMGVKRVIGVGNSAGGFGAILFGARLGAHMVHAFSPVTRISMLPRIPDRDPRNFFGDLRFYLTFRGKKTTDLNDIGINMCKGTTFFIHYCKSSRLDGIHARHMKASPNIRRLEYPCPDHKAAKYLKDRDYLMDIIGADDPKDVLRIYERAAGKTKRKKDI